MQSTRDVYSSMDTPVSSSSGPLHLSNIHPKTLFLPSILRDSLRVVTLKPMDVVVPPSFKDAHDSIRQSLIHAGAHLGQGPTTSESSTDIHEKYCAKDCIFVNQSKSTPFFTHSYITNYFYTLEKEETTSNDSTQPSEIICGRDYCQESSCTQISCFMIDSTIKSFFHERDRTRKSTITPNEWKIDHRDMRLVRFGSMTYRLPRHV